MTKNKNTEVNNMVTNEANNKAIDKENTQTIQTKLRFMDTYDAPLVKVAFNGKDGKVYVGYMLVDTGSSECLLNSSILGMLSPDVMHKDKNKEISTVQAESLVCHTVDFTFKMGTGIFTEEFYASEGIDLGEMFQELVGIIGFGFLCKHKLVLDYATEMLRTSDLVVTEPADCEFFFPMRFGLEHFGLPVVGVVNNDKEYALIADSGANNTLLTKNLVCGLGYTVSEDADSSMSGFTNKTLATTIQEVDLTLVSLSGADNDLKMCSYHDIVQVLCDSENVADGLMPSNGNDVLPISGLLSSAFMHSHKWILDFGIGVIYNRKQA